MKNIFSFPINYFQAFPNTLCNSFCKYNRYGITYLKL